ncbi:hypothetical protein [Aestuariicoccus sp. MJ-SS9]|uniref:hypothetical protein n=1 Tax=Aestuariicoccus sp. MJ-SS9 TaxID=3079855 RepID=UPI0029132906|nr:hypothetical protein [Aestuariicoccus sp. MJ-SS9]MDU8912349.1 hypothetical protein [Aestuariicoccus sp. MJ-SS9]
MTARRIFDGLQSIDSAEAQDAARAGFLEWALSLPCGAAPAAAAAEALGRIGCCATASRAARLFAGYLAQASVCDPRRPARRGGRAGRLH